MQPSITFIFAEFKTSANAGTNLVYLQIACIFSEHLFLRTPLEGCF